jgi:hypothetical protein
MTQAERITALETELSYLRQEVKEVNKKLDSLLALKNKGAGAFWLASLLFGTGIAVALSYVTSWLRS